MAPTSDLIHFALQKRDANKTYTILRIVLGVLAAAAIVTGGVLIYLRNKKWRYRQMHGAPDGINRVYG